ncbi:MAG: hypothetical protein KC439_08155 [Yoonia sp.]|jgi:hypothetical protein|nr:hypothetical protein [Yoonia sp.]
MKRLWLQLGITTLAYVAGIGAAVLVLTMVIDFDTLSLESGLPRVAMTSPMVAVVVFWGVARAAGAMIEPVRTFLFGGIAVYCLLYLCGRLVAFGIMSSVGASIFGALALFLLCFYSVVSARRTLQ